MTVNRPACVMQVMKCVFVLHDCEQTSMCEASDEVCICVT